MKGLKYGWWKRERFKSLVALIFAVMILDAIVLGILIQATR